ncbi:MAG: hypothetical protein HKL80_11730 [Acidimicrobiales bacterium]|nr:hypothetical protein [Acidimicrobiales bacterium]
MLSISVAKNMGLRKMLVFANMALMIIGLLAISSLPTGPSSSPQRHLTSTKLSSSTTPALFQPSIAGSQVAGPKETGFFNFSDSCWSPLNCYATNQSGQFISTNNGGATWSYVSNNAPLAFELSCWNSQDCVAINRETYLTTDGGLSWTLQNSQHGGTNQLNLLFCQPSICVDDGNPFSFSTDDGKTWNNPNAMSGAIFASCVSSSFCIAVGTSIWISHDSGISWTSSPLPIGVSRLFSVSCPTPTDCVATGAFEATVGTSTIVNSISIISTNSGQTWTAHNMQMPNNIYPYLNCVSSTTCYALGSNRRGDKFSGLAISRDGGVTWLHASLPRSADYAFNFPECSSSSNCLFTTPDNIFYTVDSGLTWHLSDLSGDSVQIETCSSTSHCILTTPGAIYVTFNGGGTWTPSLLSGNFGIPTYISCATDLDCIGAAGGLNLNGNTPTMFFTSDGGITWKTSAFPFTYMVVGDDCFNATNCVAVGAINWPNSNSGLPLLQIMYSQDAGKSWFPSSIPAGLPRIFVQNSNLISCDSSGNCSAIVNKSILNSGDGGLTWSVVGAPSNVNSLISVSCTGSFQCFYLTITTSGPAVMYGTGPNYSFSPLPIEVGSNVSAIACLSATNCVVAGTDLPGMNGMMAATSDGVTYNLSSVTGSIIPGPALGLSCYGQSNCVISSFNGTATSTDGGATFTSSDLVATLGNYSSISCPSAYDCVVATANAAEVTSNGGVSWKSATFPNASPSIYALDCPTVSVCYAAGDRTAYISDDGGSTWSALSLGTNVGTLFAISCSSAVFCTSIGQTTLGAPLAISTSNSGSTWINSSLPPDAYSLEEISCQNLTCAAEGVDQNNGPLIVYSSDGGLTWSDATIPTGIGAFVSVSCGSSTNCSATAVSKFYPATPIIIFTSNGGESWTVSSIPSGLTTLLEVSCPSVQSCITSAAYSGTDFPSLYSNDGGATWTSGTGTLDFRGAVSCAPNSDVCWMANNMFNSISTTLAVPSAPSTPVAAGGDGYIVASWNPPPNGSTFNPQGYVLSVTPAGQTSPVLEWYSSSQGVGTQTAEIPMLTNGVTYSVTVSAINQSGTGQSSNPSNSATPSINPAPAITSVEPNYGTVDGNTPVVITGVGLGSSGMQVTFGSSSASTSTIISNNQVDVTTPPSVTAGVVNVSFGAGVTVQNTGTGSNFTYVAGQPYHPIAPARVCDTRVAPSTSPNQCNLGGTMAGTLGPGVTMVVAIAGLNNIPSSASSAVVNITATDTTAASFLQVSPYGSPPVSTSSLNWLPGQTVANNVTVRLGTNGKLSIYNAFGSVDVVIDVEGYMGPNLTSSNAGLYFSVTPQRIVDTRPNSSFELSGNQLISMTPVSFGVTGQTPVVTTDYTSSVVPSQGVSAVVLNVTVTDTTSSGYLTLWPQGSTQPYTSDLNWVKGDTIANQVIVPVGANGEVSAIESGTSADLVVDVIGYYSDGTTITPGNGGLFVSANPTRISDTRSYVGNNYQNSRTPLTGSNQITVSLLGPSTSQNTSTQLPSANSIVAYVLNVTATDTTTPGYLTVWSAGDSMPNTSNLNWVGGETLANGMYAEIGGPIKGVDIYSNAPVDVIVDSFGWYQNGGS